MAPGERRSCKLLSAVAPGPLELAALLPNAAAADLPFASPRLCASHAVQSELLGRTQARRVVWRPVGLGSFAF